jgi:AraC-like DNA-binding protein
LLRLILSYAALSFVTIALTGIGIFWAFLNRYNHEIEALDRKIVDHTADAIEAAFMEPARSLYFELASDELKREELSSFIDQRVEGNHYRIVGISLLLKDSLEPYGSSLASVFVHYRQNRLSIDSRAGVKFQVDNPLYHELRYDSGAGGTKAVAGFWRASGSSLEYVRQYPFSIAENAPALMGISVPYERVVDTIRGLSDEHEHFFIFDSTGSIVTPEQYLAFSTASAESVISTAVAAGPESASVDLAGEQYVFTAEPIDYSDWYLGKLTTVNTFYERSRSTRNVLLIVTVSALVVCLFLSFILARYQYDPVARIARMVSGMVSGQGDVPTDDIDFAGMVRGLTLLSGEVDELRRSVAANRPLIRHQIVHSCLSGTIQGDALERRLKLLDVGRAVTSSRVLVLEFHASQLATLELEERSAMVLHLIDRIGEMKGMSQLPLASELAEDQIGIVLLGFGASDVDAHAFARAISEYLSNQFRVGHRVGIGSRVSSPSGLSTSYREALTAVAAGFYTGETRIAFEELADAAPTNAEIDQELRRELTEGLHDRDQRQVNRVVDRLIDEMASRTHAVQSCRFYLSACINDVTGYAERVGHTLHPSEHRALQRFEDEFVTVATFGDWLKQLFAAIFDEVEESARDARLIRMRRVQGYIQAHLQEPISLDSVADEFRITPSTLSRDFKSLCGVNFVDFVRDSRLQRAEQLLEESDLPVKEVAERSGFNSSSYFIQQFRRSFGVTPAHYRDARSASPS